MKEEYKRMVDNHMQNIDTRLNILDDMMNNRRPTDFVEAKRYMKEIKNGIYNVKEIISIS